MPCPLLASVLRSWCRSMGHQRAPVMGPEPHQPRFFSLEEENFWGVGPSPRAICSVEAKSRLARGHYGLGAMLHAELRENTGDVIAHRFLRDLQPLRDFDIGEAARNAVQELLFTFRQIGQLAARCRADLLVGIEEV